MQRGSNHAESGRSACNGTGHGTEYAARSARKEAPKPVEDTSAKRFAALAKKEKSIQKQAAEAKAPWLSKSLKP
jgi:hypothetical protein